MSLRLPALLGVVALAACTAARVPVTTRAPACPAGLDAGDVFSRQGVEGVFVLRDQVTGCVQTTDGTTADQGFRPQSTFKISNALIGLETGVIEDETRRSSSSRSSSRCPGRDRAVARVVRGR